VQADLETETAQAKAFPRGRLTADGKKRVDAMMPRIHSLSKFTILLDGGFG